MTELQQYNCFIRKGGNAISKHACPEAKGSDPGLVAHSEEVLTTGKSHKKKVDRLSPKVLEY